MQQLTIGKNQDGQRLDKFLKKAFPNAGTGFLYKMLRKKNITLNGKKAEGKEILAHFTEIRFLMSDRFRLSVPAVREGLLTVHISSDTCQDHEKFSQ